MSVINHTHITITDPLDGSRVVLVPLSKGKGVAKINEEDFIQLVSNGYVGKWFLNTNGKGTAYVKLFYKINNKSIANLIMSPPKSHVVRYRNNDRKDLRRSNLIICTRKELVAAHAA